jgi:hypothetical protein
VSNLDARMALAMAYQAPVGSAGIFREVVETLADRERFMTRALTFGLTVEQAEAILRSDSLIASSTGRLGSAQERLEYYAEHGYLTVLLGEVLAPDEMAAQTFSYATILNGWGWMERGYGKHFAEMDRDRQRALVKAAIELTTQLGGAEQGWPLERAMAVVMPYLEEA